MGVRLCAGCFKPLKRRPAEKRAEKIALIQQVTGWSDIMRGQSNPNETLGAQKLKTRFGGVLVASATRSGRVVVAH